MRLFVFENYSDGSTKLQPLVALLEEHVAGATTFAYPDRAGNPKRTRRLARSCQAVLCNYFDRERLESWGVPFIICDRNDSCSANSRNLAAAGHPLLLAIAKDFVYLHRALYGRRFPYHRYHLTLTTHRRRPRCPGGGRALPVVPPPVIALPWNIHQYTMLHPRMQKLAAKPMPCPASNGTRPVDVFFACNSHASCPPLHRHRLLGQVVAQGTFGLGAPRPTRLRVVTERVAQCDYLKLLSGAKVCVAPYGLGERIALEQYALLLGVLVVKPRMAHVLCAPNIYTPDMMSFCDPTWRDLPDVLRHLLTHYDQTFASVARARRARAQELASRADLARILRGTLEGVLRAGGPKVPHDGSSGGHIPRLVHFVWLGDRPLPTDVVEGWCRQHPADEGWEVRVWREQDLAGVVPRFVRRVAFERLSQESTPPNYRMLSDIARLELLRLYGGWYVDCDVVCLQSLACTLSREAVRSGAEMVVFQEKKGLLSNACIGSAPDAAPLRHILEDLGASWNRRDLADWRRTGPRPFTDSLLARGHVRPADNRTSVDWDFGSTPKVLVQPHYVVNFAKDFVQQAGGDNNLCIPDTTTLLKSKDGRYMAHQCCFSWGRVVGLHLWFGGKAGQGGKWAAEEMGRWGERLHAALREVVDRT